MLDFLVLELFFFRAMFVSFSDGFSDQEITLSLFLSLLQKLSLLINEAYQDAHQKSVLVRPSYLLLK